MKNETIIKKVFNEFGEDFNSLIGNELLVIEECMLLVRKDKANKVIREIESRINKVGCFFVDEERTKNIINKYGN